MKRCTEFLCLILALGLLNLLVGCEYLPTTPTTAPMVKPGDKIGEMVVRTGASEATPIWAFCFPPTTLGVATVECTVPALPELAVGIGWWAVDEVLRDSNWKAITYELHTIDGQPLDLNAFGTLDADIPQTGLPGHDPNEEVIVKVRAWDVVLEKPTPGLHTMHIVYHLNQQISDGFAVYEAGKYELIVNFTVKMVEPGDKIGEMVVRTGGSETTPIWAFCSLPFELFPPGVTTMECTVPALPELAVGFGWAAADEALRDSNWKAITWEHTIDGQQLDLDAFGTFDADLPATGAPGHDPNEEVILKMRGWDVVLEKPTPGLHTMHIVYRLNQQIYDGFLVNEAGTRELVVNFTVTEE